MKKLLLLGLIFSSSLAYAAGGFTWLGALTHSLNLPIPNYTITLFFTCSMILLVGLLYRKSLAGVSNVVIPDAHVSLRNFVEAFGQFIYSQCKAVIGEKQAPKYFPFVCMVFLLIFVSNVIGLVPGFLPPTENINTTVALGTFSFVYYNLKGCKELGVVNYLKHFAGPLWYLAILIFPIEILSNFIRPISLGLRLQGNMMGDHKVLETFSNLAPLIVPLPFYLLGLLVCFIQAYVFTMLSMVYISLATAHHDHEEHGHH
jgi:F-type H+-transporting ATPase subunit a